MVKVWDMRKRTSIYTIPAHSALVAAVKYVRVGAGGRGRKGDMGCLFGLCSADVCGVFVCTCVISVDECGSPSARQFLFGSFSLSTVPKSSDLIPPVTCTSYYIFVSYLFPPYPRIGSRRTTESSWPRRPSTEKPRYVNGWACVGLKRTWLGRL